MFNLTLRMIAKKKEKITPLTNTKTNISVFHSYMMPIRSANPQEIASRNVWLETRIILKYFVSLTNPKVNAGSPSNNMRLKIRLNVIIFDLLLSLFFNNFIINYGYDIRNLTLVYNFSMYILIAD